MAASGRPSPSLKSPSSAAAQVGEKGSKPRRSRSLQACREIPLPRGPVRRQAVWERFGMSGEQGEPVRELSSVNVS